MRSACRRIRPRLLATGLATAGLVSLFVAPMAHASAPARQRISDCVGTEDGHDNPDQGMSNKGWVSEQNDAAGYARYATCRFVISHASTYVDDAQAVASDSYSACDGPKWAIELKAGAERARVKAETHDETVSRRKWDYHRDDVTRTDTHQESVTDSITTAIAKVLNLSLTGSGTTEHSTALGRTNGHDEGTERGGWRLNGERTDWAEKQTGEQTLKLNIPDGKRVFFQYAPWYQKSSGYLQMTYWKGSPGQKKVVNIDLTTHTPISKPDGSLRLDYRTRWLSCRP